MSDILLSVGMQKGHVGSSQLEIDIKDVVARISKNPPKVSVGLKVDQSALNHFKSQLTQIVNSISLTNGSPITVNISGLGDVGAKAKTAKKAFDELGVTKIPAKKSLDTEYARLLTEKKTAYGEYRQARDEMKELSVIKHNIDKLLGRQETEKSEQEKTQDQR
jgi:hypothetical protein